MIDKDKRVRVIVGHYGSGKTEFAVNYAFQLAALGKKVVLCDLDVVNPYFRSRELADEMEAQGIQVISSALGNKVSIDLPMISAGIHAPLINKEVEAILDLGGDDVGARPLMQFSDSIDPSEVDVMFVLNAYREMTQDVDGAYMYMRKIEDTIGLKVTKIVSTTHLLHDTTASDLLYGLELAQKLSEKSKVPVAYVVGIESALKGLPDDLGVERFEIKMLMRKDWQRREYG